MKTFVAVARGGSFAAVARARGVAPSSISRAVAALEAELGVRLLQRTTRQLAPTDAGQRYLARLEPLLDELDAAEAAATGTTETPLGTLRVTAPLTFAQLNLMPLLPRFAAKYPELSFDLVLTDALVDLVAERIDVGLRLGRFADSTLVATKLCEMPYALCASPAWVARHGPLRTPADLEGLPVVRFPVSGVAATWRFRRKREEVEVPVTARLSAANGVALRLAAEAGLGATLLPRWNVADALARGTLVPLLPGWTGTVSEFDGAAWVLYPSRAFLPAKVRVFVDWLKAEFRDGAPADRSGRRWGP